MGERSKIAWTHHTFNPWWGCVEVTDECSRCYAKAFAKRTGHDVWGKLGARREFGDKHWAEPLRWDREAAEAGERRRVFCASMADVFEDHPVPERNRTRVFELIEATPNLDWLLLSKRPENMTAMAPRAWAGGWPRHVWAGTSAGSQPSVDRFATHILQVPASVRFLSAEPMLSAVDLLHVQGVAPSWSVDVLRGGTWDLGKGTFFEGFLNHSDMGRISWVIIGGESGNRHRELDVDAAEALAAQCEAAQVPVFVKQDSGRFPGLQGRLSDAVWALKQFPEVRHA